MVQLSVRFFFLLTLLVWCQECLAENFDEEYAMPGGDLAWRLSEEALVREARGVEGVATYFASSSDVELDRCEWIAPLRVSNRAATVEEAAFLFQSLESQLSRLHRNTAREFPSALRALDSADALEDLAHSLYGTETRARLGVFSYDARHVADTELYFDKESDSVRARSSVSFFHEGRIYYLDVDTCYSSAADARNISQSWFLKLSDRPGVLVR